MTTTENLVYTIIANILGVEPTDITPEADFSLDLNATPSDMSTIKVDIETALEVTLPEFTEEHPITVSDLMELVEDSLL